LKDLFLLAGRKGIEDLQNSEAYPVHFAGHAALDLFRYFRMGSDFAVIGQKGQMPQGFITLDNLLSAWSVRYATSSVKTLMMEPAR